MPRTVTKALTDAGETVHEVGVIERAPTAEADCVVEHADSAMAKLKVGDPDLGPRQQHGRADRAPRGTPTIPPRSPAW